MTTSAKERQPFQLWVDTTKEVVEKAKEISEKKRMTFRGFVGVALENAVEAESDKDSP